ncbi:MAG: hypothetical protein FGM54_05250 [Chitinophagaceae bacterium]|nr:hypothetical protein [Chitinophagaceae bacterium]
MKKSILVIVGVSVGLLGLVNCSPKTTKTAVSETVSKATSVSAADKAAAQPGSTSTTSTSTPSPLTSSSAKKMADMSMDEQLAFVNQADDVRLQAGKQLFEAKCGKCHELYAPQTRNKESWTRVMRSMSQKARLSDPEYAMVCAYLVKNAR